MNPQQTGVSFQNDIVETKENNIMTYQYLYNGAGLAAGDVDNDGYPDLYACGNSVPNKLFLNRGDWKFEDVSSLAGVEGRKGDWKTGVSMVDINNDGWLDIYVCYSGNTEGEGLRKPVIIDNVKRNNQLFINLGCRPGEVPKFRESAEEYGLQATGTFSTQAYFLDFDRDGDLDMFLLNHANTFYSSLFNTTKLRNLRHPYFGNKLYRNDHGKFIEVSEQSGIHGSGLNYGLSASISDINKDGWPDIYVTNDYDEQDFCYINKRNGSFKEVAHIAFDHLSKYSMGSDAADINNDQLTDYLVVDMLPEDNHRQKLLKGADMYDKYTLAVDSGYHHQNMRNTLQVNNGLNKDGIPEFIELGQMAGVSNTDWSWGALMADFDNDGWKDIFITNGYLHDYTNMDFLKFAQAKVVAAGAQNPDQSDMLSLIQNMPSTRISGYIFKNDAHLKFTNKTHDWGLDDKSISNATVYADFDNDGDLDLAVNRLNNPLALYQNKITSKEDHYIKIKLVGSEYNINGVGSKVTLVTNQGTVYQEAYFNRGYESSVEPVLTIGIGKATQIAQITVEWPDGKLSVQKNITANQSIIIAYSTASSNTTAPATTGPFLFHDVLNESGLDFKHKENNFVDFKIQRLVPYQASRLGSRVSKADVNNDGNDDVYFGGASGQSGALYLGKDDGSFEKAISQPWSADSVCEDMESLFFDADKDGDLDLYVVSGGNEFGTGDPFYHDRLYRNNGAGQFEKISNALPSSETTSGSCVTSADFDKDGDLDLFIGGRLAAQMYPITPKSFVLRNDSKEGTIQFTDVTADLSKDLQLAGMVTDASWTDIDKDGWQDLVIVGEWMPVRIFKNMQGKSFKDVSSELGFSDTEGWWSKLEVADVDNDGDQDLLLGNAGLNLQYHASKKEPMEFYIQDINNDGGPDPIMCYYIMGKSFPAPSLDELTEQATSLRKKFYKYEDYADATIKDVMGEKLLRTAQKLKIVTLASSWAENLGNGNFKLKELPLESQVSMINGFTSLDVNGDGTKEWLCVGNFFPYKVEWGKSDALKGVLLQFKNGSAHLYHTNMSLQLGGDIRDLVDLRFKNGLHRILLSRNNDTPLLLEFAK